MFDIHVECSLVRVHDGAIDTNKRNQELEYAVKCRIFRDNENVPPIFVFLLRLDDLLIIDVTQVKKRVLHYIIFSQNFVIIFKFSRD